jgi:hypothetical protein
LTKKSKPTSSILLVIALIGANGASSQTFHGAVSGRVEDPAGAPIPSCSIAVKNSTSNLERGTETTGSGDFTLPELPPGEYALTTACKGFQTVEIPRLSVAISVVSGVRIRPVIATSQVTVAVSDPAELVETASSTRNIVISNAQADRIPLNGRDFLRLLRLSPGVVLQGTSFYAVNGNRGRSNNFQIDGADNNDAWQNASAGNQGGVSAVPNTLVPVESIDQFSLTSIGNSEQGRNSGAQVNLALKSGTNQLHGTLFYLNRNEALAENSPLAPAGSAKRKIRNHQYGASFGAPIRKDKTFLFATWEGQRIRVGNASLATAPSDAWLDRGRGVLRAFGLEENPVSRNLLTLWPATMRSLPAVANNFFSNADSDYANDNGIVKVDHLFGPKHQLSARYFVASGTQTAPSGSPYPNYFQVAANTLHNIGVSLNSTLSSRLLNQFVAGVNYYKPTFNDKDRTANPVSLGLNTGVTEPSLLGAPTINVSGFGGIGPTQPQGRIDTTWHLTDTVSMQRGRHQWKFGAEIRQARLDVFNEINKRGTFVFDGSSGPWARGTPEQVALGQTFSQSDRVMADVVSGFVSTNNGAQIVRGALQRDLRQESFDVFAHDHWQLTPTFNLNFGVRYSFLATLRDTRDSLSTFLPDRGVVAVGQQGLDRLYPRGGNDFGPRVGFAWSPGQLGRWIVRGGWGLYNDMFHMTYFLSNGLSNGGASGVNANPGGPDPVYTLVRSGFQLVQNEPVFGTANPVPPFGAYSISQDLQRPFIQNYHLTLQRELGSRASAQVAYVGAAGRHLPLTLDINAPIPGATGTLQQRRPFGGRFPQLGAINELQTVGNSGYNSLQTMLNANGWRGLVARFAYTWSKSIDLGSDARFILPANSYDLRRERGRSDFDATHVFVAGFTYALPALKATPKRIGTGWEVAGFATAHTGLPIDLRAGSNISNSFDGMDRVDIVGDPFANIPAAPNAASARFFNPAAFTRPATGTFGNIGRNAISGPSFGALDFSVIKRTRISERTDLQFRVEMFNITNRANYANPGTSFAATTNFGIITNTRNGGSAPGIGPGEPRSVQLSLKLLF